MVTVRQALEHEYAEIGQLTVDAYAPVLVGAADPYRATLMDAAGRAANAELMAALDHNDGVVGTVTICRPGGPYAEIAAPGELEVRMLAVSQQRQGNGVGTTVMATVHATAAAEGYESVVLSVIDSNTEATAFYKRLGYVREADRDWQPVPDITLQVWRRLVAECD